MAHISFDSSNLKKFVQDNELGEMQAMVTACDYAKAQVLAQIFAVGSIFPLIMTRKNSIASRKLPRRFNPIPKF